MIILLFLQTSAYAMFCPTNFNQINKGDPIETVTKLCGPPESVKQSTDNSLEPQDWSYNTAPPFPGQGALNVQMSFNRGVVTSININNVGVSTTNACSSVINIGDTIQKVKSACGQSTSINQGNAPGNIRNRNSMIEFHYPGPPEVTLIFRNGKLVDRS